MDLLLGWHTRGALQSANLSASPFLMHAVSTQEVCSVSIRLWRWLSVGRGAASRRRPLRKADETRAAGRG